MAAVRAPLQISHASGLHAVGRVLADMHREMLRTSGLDGGTVRLSVLNLVAACVDDASADVAEEAVGRLGAKHPARAIVIVAEPRGPDEIEADISLRCSAVDEGQVCAEQVRLHVGGEAAYHMATVVTPLLVPDIPVYLWLVGAPPLHQAFGQDAVAICERLIIDSGEYEDAGTLRVLSAELDTVGDAISLCDVAWERARLWRQLIAQSFDGGEMRPFVHGITRVDVECSGDRISAQAWLVSGWLASRLDWPGFVADRPRVVVAPCQDDDVREHDLVRVALRCRAGGHEALVTLERRGSAIHTLIDVDGGLTVEGAVPVPELDSVDLVGRLLEGSGEDPVYRGALRSAASLAAAST